MTTIHRSALVPYTPGEMFDLVNDVEAYPDFLVGCRASEVLSRDADEVRASLTLEKGGFKKTFSTINRMQAHKMIEMRLLEGPFKHLEGFWRFEAVDDSACRVSLDIEFEFSNRLMGMAMGPMFNQIVNSLVDAFCQRAVQVYGERS